jgi:tetratricopeptide (TPR) repeat protein
MVPGSLPPASSSRHLVPLVERAIQAHRHGAPETAEKLALEVLELAPDRPGALSVLYEIRKAQGNRTATEALARRLVALDPNNFAATNELALLLLNKGDLAEAEVHGRNAVRIAPENAQSHNLMGMILTEAQRAQVAEFHYRRALELSGARDPILLANLAWNLKNQGRMEESRALYEESLAASPEVRQTLLGWARMEEADRNFDRAAELLDKLEKLSPDDVGMKVARAVVLGRQKKPAEAIAVLDAMAAQREGARLGPNELLEKGRLLDSLGEYEAAGQAFIEGKKLARELSGQQYLDQHANQVFARLRGFFTQGRLKLLPRAGVRTDVPQPLFILGFPRSGTTLVEQTLTAHPAISAGDELPLINDLTQMMPRMLNSPLAYPEALAELWMGDQRDGLDRLRDNYLARARQMGVVRDDATWFTDKMPLNETHLGLIGLLFPASPMIHVIRHPLDVMVSAISNLFTHGLYCGHALETAATHYVRVMELVEHYRSEMSLKYLPVRYEDMIADQEATVRSLLGFIGVEWFEGCLAFHENRRYARTASYAQVTEKLYDRSVGRWRHYRAVLEPAIPILAPTMEKLGYTTE